MRHQITTMTFVGALAALFAVGPMALGETGSIVGWGHYVVVAQEDLTDLVAVAAGGRHSLGLKADGSIVAWGWNGYGACEVPDPNADFIAVAAGAVFSLGLKADGSIVAWGYDHGGVADVPEPNADFVSIAAGGHHSLGRKPNRQQCDHLHIIGYLEDTSNLFLFQSVYPASTQPQRMSLQHHLHSCHS